MISVTFEENLPHEKAHKPPREQRFEGKRDLFPRMSYGVNLSSRDEF